MISFRQRLQQREVLLGHMILELFTPGIGPMLAACGLDFVIFDMEHGRCDIPLMAEMIASCRGSNIVPFARVPDVAYAPLSRVLDLGARGVMVPRVETKAQAEEIVQQLKYAPMGRRGVALGIAHDLYRVGTAEFFAATNEQICVIVLLETVKAFENLEEIISVPGIDVAWVGHYDLTVSMGIPADFDHPRFLEAMDSLVSVCRRHGVTPGFLPPTPQAAAHWINKGFRMIGLGSDIGVFLDGVRRFRAHLLEQGVVSSQAARESQA
ncbi:MAG TPA: aldolase/citrate lyase family protein [Acidobacteriaceae bacterium]|nr:aldolase/citrate lyase family protein [Acidobacteriaceae bacterium]